MIFSILHFLKYFLFTLVLLAIFTLFLSNMSLEVSIAFKIPWVGGWKTLPVSINYLLLISFCAGMLFAALLGAFRVAQIRTTNREIKVLRKVLRESQGLDSPQSSNKNPPPDDFLPPLAPS